MKQLRSSSKRQRGAVLALVVIGLLAIIAVAGFALDVSHAYLDKTKLQNALDAAALSGAMTLAITDGNTASADSDALTTFDENVAGTELEGLTPDIEYAPELGTTSFTPGTPPRFIRVKLRDLNVFNMPTLLAKVIGKETIRVGASAVAGPVSAEPCNLTPLVVCADPGDPDCGILDPAIGEAGDSNGECFGYKPWKPGDPVEDQEECYLKTGTGGGSGNTEQETGENCGVQTGDGVGGSQGDIGAGNYQLLDLDKVEQIGGETECEGGGASFIRCAFCKDIHVCPDVDFPTKPGNNVGPSAQGLNTNFGVYQGGGISADECPADDVTSEGFFSDYVNNGGLAGNKRRIKAVAIGDCSSTTNGAGTVPVKAIGCFFLTQQVEQGGGQRVWGQFVGGGCTGTDISLNPSFSQKIILYKDPESNDS
jgi:hypothetical protein